MILVRARMGLTLVAAVCGAGLLVSACGSDNTGPGGGTPVQYQGAALGDGVAGGVLVTTGPGSTASGTITLVGHPAVALTGSYSAQQLTLTGGGYSLTGSAVSGNFSGPTGGGDYELQRVDASIVTLCGNFSGSDARTAAPDSGSVVMLVSRNTLAIGGLLGVAGSGYGNPVDGALRSNNHLTFSSNTNSGAIFAADGSLADSTSASGTYQRASNVGTWQAARCGS